MLVSNCGKANNQMCRLNPPLDPFWILRNDDGGAVDLILRLKRSVRKRHAVAKVGGDRFFTGLHRRDVGGLHYSSTHQLPADKIDDLGH